MVVVVVVVVGESVVSKAQYYYYYISILLHYTSLTRCKTHASDVSLSIPDLFTVLTTVWQARMVVGDKANQAGVWRLKVKITRQYSKFMERFVLPLVFIVLVATSMPFLPSEKVGPRNQVALQPL